MKNVKNHVVLFKKFNSFTIDILLFVFIITISQHNTYNIHTTFKTLTLFYPSFSFVQSQRSYVGIHFYLLDTLHVLLQTIVVSLIWKKKIIIKNIKQRKDGFKIIKVIKLVSFFQIFIFTTFLFCLSNSAVFRWKTCHKAFNLKIKINQTYMIPY